MFIPLIDHWVCRLSGGGGGSLFSVRRSIRPHSCSWPGARWLFACTLARSACVLGPRCVPSRARAWIFTFVKLTVPTERRPGLARGPWPRLVGAPASTVSFPLFCLIFLFLPFTGLSRIDVLWSWLVGLCFLLGGFASSISTSGLAHGDRTF